MHLEITYQQLIYLPRWPIQIRDGKASLHSWEFTLSMGCQCDLHNWIMTPVLWIVRSFTQWKPQWFRIFVKSELYFRNYILLKILVHDHCKHQFPGSFCRSLLWFPQHIPWNHSQTKIMCMIAHRLGCGIWVLSVLQKKIFGVLAKDIYADSWSAETVLCSPTSQISHSILSY